MTDAIDPVNRYLGDAVRAAREATGRSQTRLADDLGEVLGKEVTQSIIARIEKGTRPTPVAEVYALATALGVAPTTLLPPETPLDQLIAPLRYERDQLALRMDDLQAEQKQTWTRWERNAQALKAAETLREELSGTAADRDTIAASVRTIYEALLNRGDADPHTTIANALDLPDTIPGGIESRITDAYAAAERQGALVHHDHLVLEHAEQFATAAADHLTGRGTA